MIPGYGCYKELNALGSCEKYVEISSEQSENDNQFFTIMNTG